MVVPVIVLLICAQAPTALAQDTEAKSLRDITGIEQQEQTPARTSLPWPLAAGAVGFVVILAGVWLLRGRIRGKATLSADRWAKYELERITALDLGAKGKADRHHFLVSNVLRGYVEKRFAIPARRRTTQEFLREILHEPRISSEQRKTLEDLLSRCDMGKFTGSSISQEQCRLLTERVLNFVESTAGTGAQ